MADIHRIIAEHLADHLFSAFEIVARHQGHRWAGSAYLLSFCPYHHGIINCSCGRYYLEIGKERPGDPDTIIFRHDNKTMPQHRFGIVEIAHPDSLDDIVKTIDRTLNNRYPWLRVRVGQA